MKENNNVSNNHKGLLRLSEEYMDWRKQVFERDDYTCQYCNIKGGYLNAHHLNGYNLFVEERIDIDNGITLCKIDHKNFHKIYGKKDNTKEQFEEWLLFKNKILEVSNI
jgi:5-methylcytosine-specific restriction endonuclease McrA